MSKANKKPNGYWQNKQRCIDASREYQTPNEWRLGNPGSYKSARENGWDEDCKSHMDLRRQHTLESCIAGAARHNTLAEWYARDYQECDAARRNGWYQQCTGHMVSGYDKGPLKWDLEACMVSASKYKTRSEWQKSEECGAYGSAIKYGWLEECCAHMEYNPSSDNDTVYIWKAPGEYFNGKPVYKAGITSERLRDRRILEVNPNAEIVIIAKVSGRATLVEKELLKLGDNPKYTEGDGRTEYRALSDHELTKALDIIKEAA